MAKQNTTGSKDTVPRNADAEKMAIGAALYETAAAAYLLEKCSLEYFYEPNYRVIFTAIESVFQPGKPIDFMLVAGALKQANSSLGVDYLIGEFEMFMSSQIYGAVEQLQETYIFRKLHVLSHDLNKLSISKTGKAKDAVDEAQSKILELASESVETDLVPISTDLDKYQEKIEKAHEAKGQITGISTGFGKIDKYINGLNPTVYTVLAARPSMGKSAFVTCMARNIAKQGIPVAIFSLEMSLQQIQARLLSVDTRIDSANIKTGQLEDREWKKVGDSFSEFQRWPIYVDEKSGQTIEDIIGKVSRAVANYGIKVVFIDHLQLVATKKYYTNRNDQLGYISSHCKQIAKENNIHIFVLSQLSRLIESRSIDDKRGRLQDLRESGNIEQDADIVMFLMRWEMYDPDFIIPKLNIPCTNKANMFIAKNRDGQAGQDILLNWNPQLTEFTIADIEHAAPDFDESRYAAAEKEIWA